LDDRKPNVVLLENVTGFIKSREGKDFASAVAALSELGYWIDAFVVDAKFFVPQSRPRVFVLGLHECLQTDAVIRQSSADWFGDAWRSRIDQRAEALLPAQLLRLLNTVQLPTGWAAVDIPPPTEERGHLSELIDLDDHQEWWDEAAVRKH